MDNDSVDLSNKLKNYKGEVNIDTLQKSRALQNTNNFGITNFLINHSGGRIKNEKQANYVLIAFALLMFTLSVFVFANTFKSKSPQPKKTTAKKTTVQKK